MNITKIKSKTTITIVTTLMELKTYLAGYQKDMMQEIVADEFVELGNVVNFRDAAKFGFICMQNGTEFDDLVEKTGTPWIATPRTAKAWIQLFIDNPYLFGITDDEITDEVEEVVLVLDGAQINATRLLMNL